VIERIKESTNYKAQRTGVKKHKFKYQHSRDCSIREPPDNITGSKYWFN